MRVGYRVTILLLAIAVSAVMMYLPYVEVKQKAVESLNEKQRLIAKQAAFGIESFFREQHTLLRHFADHHFSSEFSHSSEESVKKEYGHLSRHIQAVTFYDNQGTILYSYPDPEKVRGRSIAGQPHVIKILTDNKPNVSDVFETVQGYTSVAVSEPVFRNGEFAGVVAFLIDFEYIARTFLEDIKIGESGYAWMISRDGTELYCPVPEHTGRNVSDTSEGHEDLLAMTDKMRQGLTGTSTYRYDKLKASEVECTLKHAVYVPVRLQDNLWSISVASPESEAFSGLSSFYKKMIFSVVIFLIGVSLFAYLLIKGFNLEKVNRELECRMELEMQKRKTQERLMFQQARFYSMGETLNAIAHQWRQPLNSVGLCIQDIEESYRLGEMNDKYLTDIVRTAMKNLKELSGTIDDFRRFFAPREDMDNVNVCGVLFSIQNIIHIQYRELNIDLGFSLNGRQVKSSDDCVGAEYNLVTYPDMLKQVVMSCVQNSKEAISRGIQEGRQSEGFIRVDLSRDADRFIVKITDNGGGVPESQLDRIFDPYYSTKEVSIGMGLGLYMAKNILEEHMCGSIEIENHKDGARVTISLSA